jgi:ribonuclease BN (tRNA processing enzyme)
MRSIPASGTGPARLTSRFLEITPDAPATLGGITISALPARHDERAGPCQSYRFAAAGKVLAFSGDTAWTEAMVPLAADADVLLSECNTPDLKLANHLDWETLDAHRADLATRRLILTHMSPPMLAFTDPIPAERAHDGMIVTP